MTNSETGLKGSSRFQFYSFVNNLDEDKESWYISFIANRTKHILKKTFILKCWIESSKKLKFNVCTCKILYLTKRQWNYGRDVNLSSFYGGKEGFSWPLSDVNYLHTRTRRRVLTMWKGCFAVLSVGHILPGCPVTSNLPFNLQKLWTDQRLNSNVDG